MTIRPPWRTRTRASAAPRLPSIQGTKLYLREIADGALTLNTGEARAVIEVSAVNFALMSPAEQDAVIESFGAFLNALAFPIQIVARVERLDVAAYLDPIGERVRGEADPSLRALALSQVGLLRDLAASRVLLSRRFFVVLPGLDPAESIERGYAPWLRPRRGRGSDDPGARGHERERLGARAEEITRGLGAIGLRARGLPAAEIADLYYAILCPTLARIQPLHLGSGEPASPRELLDLIAPSHWEVRPSYLLLDDQFVRTLALVGYPRYVYTAWLGPLLGSGFPLDLSFHLTPRESHEFIRSLSGRMVRLQSSRLLDAGDGKLADPERELAFADCEKLRDALQRGDERIFSFALYVTLRASSLSELDRLTRSVETTLGGQMARTRRLVFEQEPGFRSTLPEARDCVGLRRDLDTSSVAAAFPFTSATLAKPGGILYGVNLHDQSLVAFDPFARELPNANCCVFAKSGAGKSFAVKLEAIRSLVLGVDYYIVDPENEYERLCREIGGQYVRLAASSPAKLNPFDLPSPSADAGPLDAESDPLAEKLESLLAFCELLLASPRAPLSPAERGELHAALRKTYADAGITADPATHGRSAPTLVDLLGVLVARGDPHGLGARLERFASGRLGQPFVGRTNVDLDRRLVVFNVRDLDEELLPVGTHLIADFVWGRAARVRKPRRLVVDEAWTLARSEVGGRFLAGMARRARKHFLGLTTITQDVGDFLGTESGRAVLQNSAFTLLLRQDVSAIDRLVETLKLTNGERELLLRCRKGQGLFCAEGNRVALEIVASPAEHRLITSDPREIAAIERESVAGRRATEATEPDAWVGPRVASGGRP